MQAVVMNGKARHRVARHWPDDTARTACGITFTDALYMIRTAGTLTRTPNCKRCYREERQNP